MREEEENKTRLCNEEEKKEETNLTMMISTKMDSDNPLDGLFDNGKKVIATTKDKKQEKKNTKSTEVPMTIVGNFIYSG